MTITFKIVTKKYGDKAVLSDINFSIESHEFFVLAGSSGVGKTTLLKMINRLIEPFSALDPISRKQLQELVKDLQKTLKITTVFVTHDMSEGMAMADRIAILKDGELQQVGRPQEILNAPANTFVADFFTDYQQDLSQYKLKNLEQDLATHTFSEETPLAEILNSLEDDAHE